MCIAAITAAPTFLMGPSNRYAYLPMAGMAIVLAALVYSAVGFRIGIISAVALGCGTTLFYSVQARRAGCLSNAALTELAKQAKEHPDDVILMSIPDSESNYVLSVAMPYARRPPFIASRSSNILECPRMYCCDSWLLEHAALIDRVNDDSSAKSIFITARSGELRVTAIEPARARAVVADWLLLWRKPGGGTGPGPLSERTSLEAPK